MTSLRRSSQRTRRWCFRLLLLVAPLALLFVTAGPAFTHDEDELMGGTSIQPRGPRPPGHGSSQHDMRLVGFDPLQGRSAYQPIIHQQGKRWIAYIGHHGGSAPNTLKPGAPVESNGTSVVDVTNPARPVYLFHIPGPAGAGEAGGAQMVRACDGSTLPKGVPGKTYLLREKGTQGHEVFDVTDPSNPVLVSTPVDNLRDAHKSWWECDTGIAYLVSDGRPDGWRVSRMTKVFDLSDPANPVFLRNFGLVGQEPGSTGPAPINLHGPISLGPNGLPNGSGKNRIYFGYGTGSSSTSLTSPPSRSRSTFPTTRCRRPRSSSVRWAAASGPTRAARTSRRSTTGASCSSRGSTPVCGLSIFAIPSIRWRSRSTSRPPRPTRTCGAATTTTRRPARSRSRPTTSTSTTGGTSSSSTGPTRACTSSSSSATPGRLRTSPNRFLAHRGGAPVVAPRLGPGETPWTPSRPWLGAESAPMASLS